MRVTLLGTGNAFFGAGRAQSAVLVEDRAGRWLLECGVTCCWCGNVMGKRHHRFESKVFSVRGNERCDGGRIGERNVCTGLVEENWEVVFR